MNLIYFLVGAIVNIVKFILWDWWVELLKIILDLFFVWIEKSVERGKKIMKGKGNEVNKIN